MSEYTLIISERFTQEFEKAISYKEEHGTYKSNIEKFKKEVKAKIRSLKTSPRLGVDVSSRVSFETKMKYLLVDNYLIFYEITGVDEVTIYRFISARSNWQRMLL